MTPIKVNVANSEASEPSFKPVWVNPDQIVSFEPIGTSSVICFNGAKLHVVESCEDLARLLHEAQFQESVRREPYFPARGPGY